MYNSWGQCTTTKMKAIKLNAIISGFRGLSDGALSLTVHTPELRPDQKVVFMELQNQNIDMLIEPRDEPTEDIVEVDKDVNQKTQAQRLRAVLFIYWKQQGENGDFRDFYHKKMERFINIIKDNLE